MKYKSILLFGLIGALISSCSGRVIQGSGDIVTVERRVSGFDHIDISNGMDLYFEQGETSSVELEGDDNLLPEVVTQVVGNELRVHWQDEWYETSYRPTRAVQVIITIPEIRSIDLSGGSDLFSSQIDSEQLDLNISGGGEAEIDQVFADWFNAELSGGSDLEISSIESDRIDINISGGGNIHMAGSAGSCEYDASGGSDIFAKGLHCDAVSAELSGGGVIETWAVESLDVDASGGSVLRYAGHPQLNSNTSGGSKVSSIGK